MPFLGRQQGGSEGGFVRQEEEKEEEGIFHGSTHRQKRQTEKERKEGVEILIHGAEQGDFFTAEPPTELGLVMLAQRAQGLACLLDE